MGLNRSWNPVTLSPKIEERMAEGLQASAGAQDAREGAVYRELLSHLGPDKTLLDIGAGIGRYTAPLAADGCRVQAVEPSAPMRDHLERNLRNQGLQDAVRIIPGLWPEARVDAAEVAFAAFVIQFSEDPISFVRAMEAAATKRCVLAMHVDSIFHPISDLWSSFHPDRPAPEPPRFQDLYPLLLEEGIVADVRIASEIRPRGPWRDPENALAAAAEWLQLETGEEREKLASILRERMAMGPGGPESAMPTSGRSAVISWTPRR